jgi:cytochrome c biogenesis protein CcdA
MNAAMGLIVIWVVGVRDYLLTSRLIQLKGAAAELNPVAHWVFTAGGQAPLLLLKLIPLAFVTWFIVSQRRKHPVAVQIVGGVGLVVSGLLSVWWDLALWA